jgi:hypothetical protein
MKEALKRAEVSGSSEAKHLAHFYNDLEEDPCLLLSSLEEFISWAGELKDAIHVDTCDHVADFSTTSYEQGNNNIIDIRCRKCGCSGSFALSPKDINW